MSKFKEMFSEWVLFNDGHTFAISAELTKEQAMEELKKDVLTWSKYQGVIVEEADFRSDRVQFKFGLDQEPDYLGHPQPMWYLGSKGKKSKAVWVLDMWDLISDKNVQRAE